MIIYTVSWHEKQIKSCKKQIDIQVYINCIHVDLKKTCLEMQRPTEKQELVNRWPLKKKNIINKHTLTHTYTNTHTTHTHTHTYARTHTHTHTHTRTHTHTLYTYRERWRERDGEGEGGGVRGEGGGGVARLRGVLHFSLSFCAQGEKERK